MTDESRLGQLGDSPQPTKPSPMVGELTGRPSQLGESDVREVERVHRRVAERLLAARGSVYQAFRDTGTGLSPDALEVWWEESPAARSMGDQAGKAFGCALSVAMMAVEADRALRRKGRWHVFR